MSTKIMLGLDVGTTGAKVIAFDFQGNIKASAYKEYGCVYPHPNWAEQDADMLIKVSFELVKEVTGKLGSLSRNICSIGFSTQRNAAIFLDKDGKALRMLTWQDSRSEREVAKMRSVVSDREHYFTTGLPLSENWYLPKIRWMEKNEPLLWEKTYRVVQLMEYLAKAFGADGYFLPENDANFTSCFNVAKLCWNEDFIQKFGMHKKAMPVLCKTNQPVGKISPLVARELGLPENLSLPVALGDTAAATLGAGIVRKGDVSVSMGTGGVTIAALDKPLFHEKQAFMLTHHIIRDRWQWEGLQKASAGVYRWIRDILYSYEAKEAQRMGESIYGKLNSLVENEPVGARGVMVLPYFAGSGTPRWKQDERGAILGLSLSHGKESILRACMEGITFEQKEIVSELKNTGGEIGNIRIMGGPTKSDVWNQMQADMYGRPVETLKVSEAAALGAAITGAVVNGVFSSFEQAADSLVKTVKVYEPNIENALIYNELFCIFKKANEGLENSGFTDNLAAFQKRRESK